MLDRILNSFKSLRTSKFDWMELETLSGQIAHAQKRLEAARASGNHGLARIIQHEITDTEAKRAQVLADLTKEIAGTPSEEEQAIDIQIEQAQQQQAEEKPQEPANADAIAPSDPPSRSNPPSPDPPSASDTPIGGTSMWDKVSAPDLERVKRVLANRRSELLARHAEELKALEAEQAEIDVIEQAIAAFTKKFNVAPSAEVVPFGGERVPVEAE